MVERNGSRRAEGHHDTQEAMANRLVGSSENHGKTKSLETQELFPKPESRVQHLSSLVKRPLSLKNPCFALTRKSVDAKKQQNFLIKEMFKN
jgi:hypothetical protein